MRMRTRICVGFLSFLLISVLPRQGSAVVDPSTVVGAWLFDEPSGIIVEDASGNGNCGVFVDSNTDPAGDGITLPTRVAGKFGMGMSCDGLDDSMRAPTTGFPVGNADRTIAFWVKSPRMDTPEIFAPDPKEKGAGNRLLVGWGSHETQGQASAVVMGLRNQANRLFSFWGQQRDLECTPATVIPPACTELQDDDSTDNTWYHIAATVKSGTPNVFTLYLNGVAEATREVINPLATPDLTTFFVGHFGGTMAAFEGTFDEVIVLNVALPQEDILSLMQGLATVLPPLTPTHDIDPATVVADYRFNELTGVDVADASANGNDGTLVDYDHANGDGSASAIRVDGPLAFSSGKAAKFDGGDDAMLADSTGLPDGAEERTIASWVKIEDVAQGNKFLLGWGKLGGPQGMSSLVLGLGGVASEKFAFWGDASDVEASTSLVNGTWYHVAATVKEELVTVYLDGVAVMGNSVTKLVTPVGTTCIPDPIEMRDTCFHVGNFAVAGSPMGALETTFDEISIFDVALKQGQIERLQSGMAAALVQHGACQPSAGAGDGMCELLTMDECLAQSGTYLGDGTSCPTGACQLDGGACLLLTAAQCTALNGTYGGDGVPCVVATFNIPGDCNQDGTLDLSDVICLLGHLFQGNPSMLPCSTTAGNLALIDVNTDVSIDLSDAVYLLAFLFQGGPPPEQGQGCIEMAECPQNTMGCP